ncbi:MAG TPA: cell division protein FtsQ/DivIB [Coxiellaceae bacterium]|nr:cell division protein FtsQ/DivIB [Coxiellaceae bacterium]
MSKSRFYRKKSHATWSEALKTISRTVLWGGLVVLVLAGAYEAWLAIGDPKILPIRQVSIVSGDLHVSKAELEKAVQANLRGTLLTLDRSKLKHGLRQLPWVENVSIRRVWPDKLVIKITEQVPVARWEHTSLLNKDLEKFSPPVDSFPSGLPSLLGPKGSESKLWKQYQELNQRFEPLKLKVVSVELSPRSSWSFLLSNGVEVILGRQDLNARLARLVRLYPRLVAEHPSGMMLIDLRYPSGFAIKWKDEEAPLKR